MAAARDVQESMFPDLVPARPQGWIMPSVFTGTNSDLMKAIAPIYLTGSVLDVTYGDGKWWDRFTPDPFTAHDLHKVDGIDFRCLPEADRSVDTVCYDPPYTISGGDSTGRMADSDFQHRYGIGAKRLDDSRPSAFDALVLDGLSECIRVSRRFVLVKCMEFAQGGGERKDFHDTPHAIKTKALELGCWTHDVIVHHTGSGPGGHNIFVPKRARRHHSYLIVFAKGSA